MKSPQDISILFIANHRLDRSPNQRFRFEQYLNYFTEKGIKWKLSNIISEADDKVIYKPGKYFGKAIVMLKSLFRRWKDVREADKYDIIFVCREAHMLGTDYFERQFAKSKAKVIFDLDDAIWLADISEANRSLAFLKNPDKTNAIFRYADMVFAGNEYLANQARKFNKNVKIVPTTIDTDTYHQPAAVKKQFPDKICIGWTGSMSTVKHFEHALPMLEKLYEQYEDKIYFKLINERVVSYPSIGLTTTKWEKEKEVEQLNELDIGIMPLPDDDWSRGKCGFKGLQYMSLGIPAVMSPVGVNMEIISDGENGYLAATDEEWLDKLGKLIVSETLRKDLGEKGRQTIINSYSKRSQQDRYIAFFQEVLD